jgi:ribosomal-protein-alanine N-acetyltransferase
MIESERLLFRPFNNDDFDDLYEILSNEKVCEFLPGEGKKSSEEIEKWLAYFTRSFNDEQGTTIYAITIKDTTKVIGYGGIGYVKEFDQLEIMYGFNEDVWGKGYATETSIRMKELAKERNIKQVIALADINNLGSQKVLKKTGFKEIRQIEIWGLDCFYYEMTI